MLFTSPRNTVIGQTDASSPTVTSPITSALSSMKALSAICGRDRSKSRSMVSSVFDPGRVSTRRPGNPSGHSDQFFRAGRVNRHGIVESRLGSTHADRHCEPLQHLVGSGPNNVRTDNAQLVAY